MRRLKRNAPGVVESGWLLTIVAGGMLTGLLRKS